MPEVEGGGVYRAVFSALPSPCLLLDDGLVILDATGAYLAALDVPRAQLVGQHLFEAFPVNPDDPAAQVALEESLRRALATGLPDRLPLLRYDVEAEPGSGRFEERWWTVANSPVLDPAFGGVRAVVNAVEDVTELVWLQERSSQERAAADDLRVKTRELEDDLYARSRELASIAASEALATRRLTGLAEAALDLATAETVEALAAAVLGRGLVELGADGGAVGVRDDSTGRLVLTWSGSSPDTPAELPLDGPLPPSVAALTGQPVLLGDPGACAPAPEGLPGASRAQAWVALPLLVGSRVLGSLTASWTSPQAFTPGDMDLMAALAAQCAQVLDRLLVRQAERQAATVTRRLSEALQRSLLTAPPQPDGLQIAVRYLPAAQDAQVGGDWYDAFLIDQDGKTSLVIGDVAGHDQDAAAAMAQVRNVLRGVAHTLREPPAAVLSALDQALADLAVGALATAVLAQVEQDEHQAARRVRVLRWSNAGHPPPLLLHPDGRAELLARPVDLLLGLEPATPREDHSQVLEAGSTVLLYTDGLVERRDASLDAGLQWLAETAQRLAGLPLEELCDALLGELETEIEDDVAVLALRVHPQSSPRPAAAGPDTGPSGT